MVDFIAYVLVGLMMLPILALILVGALMMVGIVVGPILALISVLIGK